ncbi:MAG TPA: class I SAM-dependent rRNA methyltransferase [Lentimicrobium sp.]|nr:class I SAM-dependent rRNA methyltransferase [Lentimicrobium sp.]
MAIKSEITLKNGRDESVKRFHPWIFSGAIDHVSGQIEDGDEVDVFDSKHNYLGTGHAALGSIAVKLFWFGPEKMLTDIWYQKLSNAYSLRQKIGYTSISGLSADLTNHLSDKKNSLLSNAYRLIFSEADGMPGVIIDYYNGVAVIQSHSMGMHLIRKELTDALIRLYGDKLKGVYSKSNETLARSGIKDEMDEFLYQNPKNEGYNSSENTGEQLLISENGRTFIIDIVEGQKTGFFLDQRENRALLGSYSKNMKVLNAFCYTGGFSIYALTAGARHVTSLDSSSRAMSLLEKNLAHNTFTGTHKSVTADAKQWLTRMDKDFDVVILDPPAFAKRQADKHKATQGYRFINQTAIKNIKQGGLLFTFSCSQAISSEMFTSIIMSAALDAGRNAKILHHLTHSPDHPVSIFHPEGEYLKGLVLLID